MDALELNHGCWWGLRREDAYARSVDITYGGYLLVQAGLSDSAAFLTGNNFNLEVSSETIGQKQLVFARDKFLLSPAKMQAPESPAKSNNSLRETRLGKEIVETGGYDPNNLVVVASLAHLLTLPIVYEHVGLRPKRYVASELAILAYSPSSEVKLATLRLLLSGLEPKHVIYEGIKKAKFMKLHNNVDEFYQGVDLERGSVRTDDSYMISQNPMLEWLTRHDERIEKSPYKNINWRAPKIRLG